ncbi:BspA family leucine-rich repeat surface protein [Mycoplasma feriruminatoris]|uniref:BspA family leucine-rich repeat surface protein n=1 Tax=Mycoplasma feriruminatoris TaxID=1179777 RepID=A0ABY8HVS5_9MOLU|nr:BspA family leucine-rich repeat surface protein [Mycoplasma feriruminatoris]WFQ93722.1 BspA family leucine-rich repeat surface protein [Mycoplasma feriruminatoris]
MKKILTMLTSFSLIAISSVLVVSCKIDQLKDGIEKLKEIPNNVHKENEDKNNHKNSKHIDTMQQGDQPSSEGKNKSNSTLSYSNKDNIFSRIEDERDFIKNYYNWWKSNKHGNVNHYINPENPNEILILGYEKTNNPKDGYKLKEIPSHINKVPKELPSIVTSLESAFKNNQNEKIDGIEYWDTSRVKNMYQTFFGASKFNTDISKWKTSSVIDMSYMFAYTNSFNRDLSEWNVDKTFPPVGFAKGSSFENNIGLWPHFKKYTK